MPQRQFIPAGTGLGLQLRRGQHLRVIDPEGGQSGDLVAFSQAGDERLSNGRSVDYAGKVYLSTGDVLWSDRSKRMLTIVADDAGRHDFLYAPCSVEMYRMQYGMTGSPPNCHDNLSSALRQVGITPDALMTPFNLFMNVQVLPDGRLEFLPPKSRAGDAIVFRAEMDLAVAVTSCPCANCNGGAPPKPLAVEIVDDWAKP